MTGYLEPFNRDREAVLANLTRQRELESAGASLTNMKGQLDQMKALADETKGVPSLHERAQAMLQHAEGQYYALLKRYEVAKAEFDKGKASDRPEQTALVRVSRVTLPVPDVQDKIDGSEDDGAAERDRVLLDSLLEELVKHRGENGNPNELALDVLKRIADDHTLYVTGEGRFTPVLLNALYLNRAPGDRSVSDTVERLLVQNVEAKKYIELLCAQNNTIVRQYTELARKQADLLDNIEIFKSIVQAAADRTLEGIAADSVPLGMSPERSSFLSSVPPASAPDSIGL